MANRLFKPIQGSLTQGVTCLTGNWTFGASGAATVSALGFSVGEYDESGNGAQIITLDDKYSALLSVEATFVGDADFLAAEGCTFELTAEDVNGAGTMTLRYMQLYNGATQTEANLDGKKVYCMIWLKNSSV